MKVNSCGLTDGAQLRAAATMPRHISIVPSGASQVPPEAALRAVVAPPRDGRRGSWSDWLDRPETLGLGVCVEGHEIVDAGYARFVLAVTGLN
jgi:hypothetical protein